MTKPFGPCKFIHHALACANTGGNHSHLRHYAAAAIQHYIASADIIIFDNVLLMISAKLGWPLQKIGQ